MSCILDVLVDVLVMTSDPSSLLPSLTCLKLPLFPSSGDPLSSLPFSFPLSSPLLPLPSGEEKAEETCGSVDDDADDDDVDVEELVDVDDVDALVGVF